MRAEVLWIAALLLAGCGSAPKPADPPRLRAALEAESEGAKRYERGDYLLAVRRFDEAAQLHASIDDVAGTTRNRLHQSRTELALGRPQAALAILSRALPAGSEELDALLLTAQAQLALSHQEAAQRTLAAAASRCAAACPQRVSLNLLQGRAALSGQRAAEAEGHARSALKLLEDKGEGHETANAWRLIAAARLAGGDPAGALPAAQLALDIDRRLAMPEKIARDWILIGDIRQRVMRSGIHPDGDGETAMAYQRALDVANAAGLAEIASLATLRLAAHKPAPANR